MSKRKEPTLRVLHLASFAGNIGDVANHAGAGSLWRGMGYQLETTRLEIREFYWGQRRFDDAFVEWANSFDLLIVGGGNYFELWVEKSETGTSIDISLERLRKLVVPTVFYSLGVDIGQGYTDQTQSRFRAFMDQILANKNFFVCVRNDGSSTALAKVLGGDYAARVPVMPDGGFMAGDSLGISAKPADYPEIGINIAGDMLERRFDGEIGPGEFLTGLARTIEGILDSQPDARVVLFPHIWRDVQLVASLLLEVKDHYLRRRVRIAELNPTHEGLGRFLTDYSRCHLILGMRFHANVCPIGMGIPTIGLLNYPQVSLLYGELGLQDRLLDVRGRDFSRRLQSTVMEELSSGPMVAARMAAKAGEVKRDADSVFAAIARWLDSVSV